MSENSNIVIVTDGLRSLKETLNEQASVVNIGGAYEYRFLPFVYRWDVIEQRYEVIHIDDVCTSVLKGFGLKDNNDEET